MKTHRMIAAIALLVGSTLGSVVLAGNHATYVGKGPFKSGPDVTRKCIECHEKETKDFMATVHWTWSSEQVVDGRNISLGKKNALNNFCIGLPSNWPRCTSCHAGYGWKNADFDFTKAENVDCLSCHDTTGTYKKFPTGAGHPVYEGETKEFPKGNPWPPVDLVKVAPSVGAPTRAACGACHFYGGGDHISTATSTAPCEPIPRSTSTWAAREDGLSGCHKSKDHSLKGRRSPSSVRGPGDGMHRLPQGRRQECCAGPAREEGRLPDLPHPLLRQGPAHHGVVGLVHRRQGRETRRRPEGQVRREDLRQDERQFPVEKDVPPISGTTVRSTAISPATRSSPSKAVKLSAAKGSRKDRNARIFPFKLMRGKQAYDSGNNHDRLRERLRPPGSDAYWAKYDWNAAIAAGMKAAGQPYSGKYGFVETSMVWPVNHGGAQGQSAEVRRLPRREGAAGLESAGLQGRPRNPENRRKRFGTAFLALMCDLAIPRRAWMA